MKDILDRIPANAVIKDIRVSKFTNINEPPGFSPYDKYKVSWKETTPSDDRGQLFQIIFRHIELANQLAIALRKRECKMPMNKDWPKIPEGAKISGVLLLVKQEFGPLQDSTPFLEVAYFCNGKFEKKEFHTNGNAKEACSEAEAFRKYLLLLEKQNKPDTQSMRDEILEERSKISDIPER